MAQSDSATAAVVRAVIFAIDAKDSTRAMAEKKTAGIAAAVSRRSPRPV